MQRFWLAEEDGMEDEVTCCQDVTCNNLNFVIINIQSMHWNITISVLNSLFMMNFVGNQVIGDIDTEYVKLEWVQTEEIT